MFWALTGLLVILESLKSVRAIMAPTQVITSFQSSGGIGLKKKSKFFFFKIFAPVSTIFFFFELKFFKKFFYNPKKLFSPLVLNTKNGNYIKD